MPRIRGTGRPNGRPPLEVTGDKVDLHLRLPAEVMRKIDSLRQGADTRNDVITRVLREYEGATDA